MTVRRRSDVCQDSFGQWYEATYPQVIRTLTALARDQDLAAEVAGDAFVKAYEKWDHVSNMESPRQWVLTVAINRLRRVWRRRSIEHRQVQKGGVGIAAVERPDASVWEAVNGLPPRQREAVVLRYIADLSEREIAQHLGITEGGASSLLTKARSALRTQLKESDHDRV